MKIGDKSPISISAMQKVFRNFMNIFVAITLAAFIVSAISSSVFASSFKADASTVHFNDGQKSDKSSDHQNDGQCDDGCCISHCFHCTGFAIPATQTFSVPSVSYTGSLILSDQKAEGNPSAPQLRPPKQLA